VSIVFLFPGQGVEPARLAAALPSELAPLLERAAELVELPLRRKLERGGIELSRTAVYQPTLTAICLEVDSALRRGGVRPDFVAGHSLGEIPAWSSGRGIDAGDAVELAADRGRIMAREAGRYPGAMLAVRGATWSGVRAALKQANQIGLAQVAAANAPGDWVLSGERSALSRVARESRAQWLPVEGAWHSHLLAGGVAELRARCESIPRAPMRATFVLNRTGRIACESDEIPGSLAGQLDHPIHWVRSLRTLAAAGARWFVTVGPGKQLRDMVRRTLGETAMVYSTDSSFALSRTIEALAR